MKIKKFEAETLQGALAKVKKDFGPDAVILQTKRYKKGSFLGLFGKDMTEVTAGIDINIERQSNQQSSITIPKETYVKNTIQTSSNFLNKSTEIFETYNKKEDLTLKNEILLRELNAGKILINSTLRPLKDGAMASPISLKNGMGKIQKLLINNGVEENLVYRTLQNLNSQLSEQQINNSSFLEHYLCDYISELIQVSGPIKTQKGTTKVIAFIGATGVGKTTTIAKLAAKLSLMEGNSIVMVSADTYRIAADMQLKKYGEIMGIPVEIVLTPLDFKKVINKHIDKDIILFDTAGRSPRNRQHLSELKNFLEAYSPIEIHLVMSAVTKYYDALSIINNFGLVPIHRILFTKLDETKNYGLLLNLSVNTGGIPISYLSTGQTVPDDITVAESKAISRLIVKGDFETWIRQKD
ncbi:MAG: flagellar biosynthesis protein FlhF [Candidatus Goldbacteria bacterium]|nr:flagellar biosynthesis protein FlhF [Candidatus Goldiibacteriota bacterium]